MKRIFKKPPRKVSERMKKIKSRSTNLEKRMEQFLRTLHLKYIRQPKVDGHPDFRIRNTNVLIFCDSSFWHGRREKEVSGKAFKRNKRLWVEKLIYNRKRDQSNNRRLRLQGWSVQRFWDTDILKNPDKVKNRLWRVVSETKD